MIDNIDKDEIRKAIDRLQVEHPCHFAFDATKFDSTDTIDVITKVIDNVMESIRDDADIHIICEMAKLYLDGVKPTIEDRPHGEWIENPKYNRRGKRFFNCSVCHYGEKGEIICEISDSKIPNFCPNCGAKMKGGDEK